ncbi:protocatechuate 3,4-dioxygenase beta subunit [Microbacterium phyllosphaerae]|uniref:Protocatechuate 3,4-dioxygenase beta subunit n=1 Tax=Microbacterium phyllosphaerae TaxID=124798 RepID=A0ABS4WN39_9MICO|nr:intradiol ring-cleavage dioxygenase [Microbacterium phyllosphaerae]MBP2377620.1 protocatechuate 3,4-dioxygenase beta subunit [Microbacterium phyllosphaerae]
MSRIPEPVQTPEGPTYEGRLLDRADEEVVDQGAAFDIRTLVTRRGVLGLAGLGVGAVVLAACAPAATGTSSTGSAEPTATTDTGSSSGTATAAGEIPDETAGPYPGDGSNGPDVLEESGIVRQDITTSIDGSATADGIPLTFEFEVLDMANGGVPFEGVAVYAWHCTAQGEYSMYSSGLEDVTYLRGVQVADAEGKVSFSSVFPGCYSGRWPHIHFEVYPDVDSITDSANAIATSQMALPEDACSAVYADSRYDGSSQNLSQTSLAGDNVFGDDSAALQLPTITGDVTGGYTATLVVGVDTTTTPSAGSAPSGGDGGPGGGQAPSN